MKSHHHHRGLMNDLLVVLQFLSLFACLVRAAPTRGSFTEFPSITSVERVDENTLRVQWQIEHDESKLARFRIFFTIEGDEINELFEWPAQLRHAGSEMVGTQFRSFTLRTAFECYSWCISDPICLKSTFRSMNNKFDAHPNCFMKTTHDVSIPGGNFSHINTIEHVEITEYKKEAIIRGIATNIGYAFSVIVYDKEINDWSSESTIYNYSPPKLETQLKYENQNGHLFSWTPPKSGQDRFTISRYNLILWPKNQPAKKQVIIVKDGIAKYKFEPDYFNIRDDPILADDEMACFVNCLNKPNCVRFVFHTKMNRCYLLPELDLTKSQLVARDLVAYSLKRQSNRYRLRTALNSDTEYNAQIEMITPFGTSALSNIVRFNTGREDGSGWPIEANKEEATTTPPRQPQEEVATTKKPEVTSTEKPQPQPQQPDEYLIDNNNSGSGSGGGDEPEVEVDETKPEIDYNEIGGGSDSGSGSGGDSGSGSGGDSGSGSGDSEVTTFDLSMSSNQTKRVNDRFEIECTFRGSNKKTLAWSKLDDELKMLRSEVTVSEEGASEKFVTSKLVFDALSRKDDGTYSCMVEDKSAEPILLRLSVKSAPSKPKVEKVMLSDEGLFIKWSVEDDGGLEPFNGGVDLNKHIDGLDDSMSETFELTSEDLKAREVLLKNTGASKDTSVRVWVENAFGASEKSDETKSEEASSPNTDNSEKEMLIEDKVTPAAEVVDGGVEKPEVKPIVVNSIAETVGETTASANEKTAENVGNKPKPLNIILVFAAILVLILLGYAVYRCRFAGNDDKKKDKREAKSDAAAAGEKDGGDKELLEKQKD